MLAVALPDAPSAQSRWAPRGRLNVRVGVLIFEVLYGAVTQKRLETGLSRFNSCLSASSQIKRPSRGLFIIGVRSKTRIAGLVQSVVVTNEISRDVIQSHVWHESVLVAIIREVDWPKPPATPIRKQVYADSDRR